MKKIIASSILMATLLLTGCSDSPETVAEKYMDIAMSGNLDEIKEVSTKRFYSELRHKAERCLTKGLNSRDKKNEEFVKETTKAIKDEIRGVPFGDKYMALMNAREKEIRKVLNENKYPIVEECKSDTLWKYTKVTDLEVLGTEIEDDEKQAKVIFKVFFKNGDGRAYVNLKNDIEHGWQVYGAHISKL
jgi:hypothetical protein